MSEEGKKTRSPLYETMRRNLIDLIETEHVNYLPNEKELMSRYHVSRNTLRHAIRQLTSEGIVQPMQGIGTLVHPVCGLREESRILLVYDVAMLSYQQEMFQELLFQLGCSKLRANILMIDKENVDIPILESHLKECDAVIVDMLSSFSPVVRDLVSRCGKKRICLRWNATNFHFPSVETDIGEGIYSLMKHLLELGHRRFIALGSLADPNRHAGFVRALSEYGLDLSCILEIPMKWKIGMRERELGMLYARELFEKRTGETAVIANNDMIALCVEEVALEKGVKIPEELSVIGFDNIADAEFFPVPLTTCSGNMREMIQEAIAYLFSSSKPNEMFYKKMRPELVIRQSTGPAKHS